MGIATIGGSTATAVDTTKPPRLTFANRYSWSTTSGSTTHGAMTYRSTDNSLYKLDNVDSASQTFQKWSLSSNSSTSLTRLQGTSNASPLSRPQLVTGYDGDIYCMANTANTTTYNFGMQKYSVSGNTWSDLASLTGIPYSQSVALLPPIPSHFSNSSDTLVVRGNLGSTAANSQAISNLTNQSQTTGAYNYDTSSSQIVGATHVDYFELRDGHDKNPTGLIASINPWLGNAYIDRMAIGSITYGNTSTDPRTSGFARINWQTAEPFQVNSTNLLKRIAYGGGDTNFQKGICIESRWFLIGAQSGWMMLDIFTGAITTSSKMHVPSGTNPVYISSTKKLYFHATDNYLYEYNVTFGS